MYNKIIDLKVKKVKLTEVNELANRIKAFADLDLNPDQMECFEALIYNFQKGNYNKANDIANMLDTDLSNMSICKEVTLTVIK